MNYTVSVFPKANSPYPEPPENLENIIRAIREGAFKEDIAKIRDACAAGDEGLAKKLKIQLPGFTATGVFSYRNDKCLTQYTGLISIDIDNLPGGMPEAISVREQLLSLPFILYAYVSPRGNGVKAGALVDTPPTEHKWAFEVVESTIMGAIPGFPRIDPSGKDLSRLSFVSADDGAGWNKNLKGIVVPTRPQTREAGTRKPSDQPWPTSDQKRLAAATIDERRLGPVNWVDPMPEGDVAPKTVLGFFKCPGEHRHTGRNGDKDCCLMVGDSDPVVAHCVHESCEEEVRGLNDQIMESTRDAILLPVAGVTVSEFGAEVGRRMKRRRHWFVTTSREIVGIDDEGYLSKETNDPFKTANLVLIDEGNAPGHAEKVARFASRGKKSRGVACSMTGGQAKMLLSTPQLAENLPVLAHVESIPMPFLKADGEVVYPEAGYNPDLWLWLSKRSPVPEQVGIAEARNWIAKKLWEDFPFREEITGECPSGEFSQSRLNAISCLLTGYCRYLLRPITATTPLFVFQANGPRAGKDAMANLIQIVNTGRCVELSLPASEEEFQKLMVGVLSRGARHLHFSNIRGTVDMPAMERYLTSEFFTGRQLGSHVIREIQRTCTTSISANLGFSFTTDLRARSISIDLHVAEANPNARTFHRPDLLEEIKRDRPKIVGAMRTVVEHWIREGAPNAQEAFTSAHEWQRVIGGIIRANWGCEPKNAGASGRIELDPLENSWQALCRYMLETNPGREVKTKDIREAIETINSQGEDPLFFEWMDRQHGNIMLPRGRQALGRLLQQMVGRQFPGGVFQQANPGVKTEHSRFRWIPIPE